jgi:predicted DNA binding CopG/RHH family protein
MPNYVKNEKRYSKVKFDAKVIKEAYSKRKTAKKFPTSISLNEDVVADLKFLAAKKGIPYQTLMRMLIVEGLEKKLKKAA